MTMHSARRITSSSRSGKQDRSVQVQNTRMQICPKCHQLRSEGGGAHAAHWSEAPPGFGANMILVDCQGDPC
jgi:hypothetical protein